jgi:hypothetical protein
VNRDGNGVRLGWALRPNGPLQPANSMDRPILDECTYIAAWKMLPYP